MRAMKERIILICVISLFTAGCSIDAYSYPSEFPQPELLTTETTAYTTDYEQEETSTIIFSAEYDDDIFINPNGSTVESRFILPSGYCRTDDSAGSLTGFVRNYPLKECGSCVSLYNGSESDRQWMAAAVFDLPVENCDLQQCADSVMRMYAEYFYASGQNDRIAFHYVDGTYHQWTETGGYDGTYANMVKYLHTVFNYANTASMAKEGVRISVNEAQIGDVVIKPGFPGHVIMIVDVCINERGEKAFLFAQGLMPAQDFHVIINPVHKYDPWYYETEIGDIFETPGYKFQKSDFMRLNY